MRSRADAADLLALWEHGAAPPGWRRDRALLQGTAPGRSLAGHQAALLALRAQLFGRAWPLRADCPACGATAEWSVDAQALADDAARGTEAEPGDLHTLDVEGRRLRFRLPDADDLQAASTAGDAGRALDALVSRCCIEGLDPGDAPSASVLEALAARMAALAPGARTGFDLQCPACGHAWSAAFDPGHALWRELDAAAEAALLDIDALARAYGWREDDVLALSPRRRAAYLQLAEAR